LQSVALSAIDLYRSIVLAKGKDCWVFEFLFAKQDMANIADDELRAFRKLAKSYAQFTPQQVTAMVSGKHWIEIQTSEPEK
jgi:hypothetical protein